MKATLLALAGLAVLALSQTPALISSCGGYIKWTNITVTPAAPQAGDTAVINATGVTTGPTTGGAGAINAYIYGSNLFNTNINTCGTGQQIDIYGVTTATFDALACPTTAGGNVTLGFVLPIPQQAAGLGAVNVTLAANDTSTPNGGRMVYCIDLVATV